MSNKIYVGITGARGMVGAGLYKILSQHPEVEVKHVFTSTPDLVGKKFENSDICYDNEKDAPEIAKYMDVLFLAGKDVKSDMAFVKENGGKTRIITVGGAYRLCDTDAFKKYYKEEHTDTSGLVCAIYGLPEMQGQRERIRNANLIANPGCYAAAASLALLPVAKLINIRENISIVGISGVSGAGNSKKPQHQPDFVAENTQAYNWKGGHQHIPEILQNLIDAGLRAKIGGINFTPVVDSKYEGILTVCCIKAAKRDYMKMYKEYYADCPFIRISEDGNNLPEIPGIFSTKPTVGTNFTDINLAYIKDTHTLQVMSALGNLDAGAATKAVQNMNIMFGLDERTGLVR